MQMEIGRDTHKYVTIFNTKRIVYATDNMQIHAFISCIYAFISINLIIWACYHDFKMIKMIIFMSKAYF